MAYYAQVKFAQVQGINGQFPISEIGTHLVADVNLLADMGRDTNPGALNEFYRDNGVYVSGQDGIADDLTWSSVSQFDSGVQVSRVGTGWPQSNNAKVKFVYIDDNGHTTVNIAKVYDHTRHLIVDSSDGSIKSGDVFGLPVEYATYARSSPQDIPQLVNAPSKLAEPTDAPPLPKITPVAFDGAKRMHVVNPDGAPKYAFGSLLTTADLQNNIKTVLPFNAELWVSGWAHVPLLPTGKDFVMDTTAFGDFPRSGKLRYTIGFLRDDLADGPAKHHKKVVEVAPAPVEPPPLPTLPDIQEYEFPDWKETYKAFHDMHGTEIEQIFEADGLPRKLTEVRITDLLNIDHPKVLLGINQPVHIRGDFIGPDGVEYWRYVAAPGHPRRTETMGAYYGIPKDWLTLKEVYNPETTIQERKVLAEQKRHKPTLGDQVAYTVGSVAAKIDVMTGRTKRRNKNKKEKA